MDVWNKLPLNFKSLIDNVLLISHDDLSEFDLTEMKILTPNSDKEIAIAYQTSDIFISTSWREGFGLPPLEAMSCGCACIISDSGGVNEYAVPNVNCLLFPPKEENKLMEQLITLVKDDSLRCSIAKKGYEDSSLFTWDKSAEQFLDIITL